jgi:hypothetical protein
VRSRPLTYLDSHWTPEFRAWLDAYRAHESPEIVEALDRLAIAAANEWRREHWASPRELDGDLIERIRHLESR